MRLVLTGSDDARARSIAHRLSDALGLKFLEIADVPSAASHDWCVIAATQSVMFDPDLRRELRDNSILILLIDSEKSTDYDVLSPYADVLIRDSSTSEDDLLDQVLQGIHEELSIRYQSANTFGEIVRITTYGESHGTAVGAVLDGIRPGIELSVEDIQNELNRRRPGQSAVTTSRKELDQVQILSGVFDGKTTGAPIGMVIFNRDHDPSRYETIRDLFRPGHADFTFYRKYGIRDHRGGGRSSGRETAARVACGAVARKILAERGVRIVAHAVEIAGIRATSCDLGVIELNSVRCADPEAAVNMERAILEARDNSDSVGGIVQLEIHGAPVGLGDPVFNKLDARLTYAIMTLGAVKGVEVGEGFALARMHGSESNDPMSGDRFESNNAGGITGGISTGQPIVMRAVVKPTSSIARTQKTIDIHGIDREIEVHGRHDPCIVPRVIPVIENMAALVILDAWEVQSRLRPDWAQRTR